MTGALNHVGARPGAGSGWRGLLRIYGWSGLLRLTGDVIVSRLSFPHVRIIRRPFAIRGHRHLALGKGFTAGVGLRVDAFGSEGDDGIVLRIGDRVEVNDHVHIAAVRSVSIGDDCLIASRVFISDHNHGDMDADAALHGPDVPPARRPLAVKPVVIGRRVWIGEAALILPGVTIGDGAVIGGGSVVTRDVQAGAVVIGSPARVVRLFDRSTGRWQRVASP